MNSQDYSNLPMDQSHQTENNFVIILILYLSFIFYQMIRVLITLLIPN